MIRWRKLGLVYAPDGRQPWARSHAMLPTPLAISGGALRLYVAHLDDNSVGRIGFVDVPLRDPTRPIAVSQSPVFDIGSAGAFDDHGVVPSCIVASGSELRLYYSGFQLQDDVPYTIFSSIAISHDDGRRFERITDVPLLDRAAHEGYFRAAPFVLRGQDRWQMWYIGGDAWTSDATGKRLPCYSLRYTESADGMAWPNPGIECLKPRAPHEIGFGRPFVWRDGSGYRMWLSIRERQGYRLGYAESADGLAWQRCDDVVGLTPSETGWDSEMICYAVVVDGPDRQLMFYNGNGYGRSGVGVAVGEPDR